jgi:hypothetical protein
MGSECHSKIAAILRAFPRKPLKMGHPLEPADARSAKNLPVIRG